VLSHEHIIVSNGEDSQHYPWLYDRQKTLDAGFDLHLAKPLKPHALLEAIGRLRRPSGAA